MRPTPLLLALAATALAAAPVAAQPSGGATDSATRRMVKPITIQHTRPVDQRGMNTFETPKADTVTYDGFRLDWGAAFTQQFQGLDHENSAVPVMRPDASGREYDANQLIDMGPGFNNATANLYLNAQLAPGIRVALTTYLSSRHHQETWVKDGYLQIDESLLDIDLLHRIMDYVTVKAGHFEINYGDAHFRRTDNGNAIHNRS